MTDLFLYNGFTPRRRSPGDLFLDNGMGLLRAYMKKEGINFIIEDKNKANGYKEFRLPEFSRPLRELFSEVIFFSSRMSIFKKLLYKMRIGKLYKKMIDSQNARMELYLNSIKEAIAKEKIPVVGMKVWFGDTFLSCVKLCNMIREVSPETIVVVGGPHANVYYNDGIILKYSPFDLAVYSEGEYTLARIVKIARQYKTRKERLDAIIKAKLPNMVYRSSDGIKINPTVPIPINEKLVPEYTDEELDQKIRAHTIIDGLGCDYGKCSFCIHPFIYPKFRLRDPRIIVDEIESMIRRGIGFFTFTASDTPLPHAKRISEEILKRNMKIEFTMLARASKGASTRKEYLVENYRSIIRAGMKILYIGAESGNDDVLREVLNKNIVAQDIIETVKCVREASRLENSHVYIITSYIFPIPLPNDLLKKGVTLKRVFEDDVKLGKSTMPDSFQVMPAAIYPGPEWYVNAKKYNITMKEKIYGPRMLAFEWSAHALARLTKMPYLLFRKNTSWIAHQFLKLSRAINMLGIPSDLNDEHILFARCAGFEKLDDLKMVSRELFLDIISCDDDKTFELFSKVNAKSMELAASNKL